MSSYLPDTPHASGCRCWQCIDKENRPKRAERLMRPWRISRKVGRTIYVQAGPEPSDRDKLIGVMDTPELAALVIDAVNRLLSETTRQGESQ